MPREKRKWATGPKLELAKKLADFELYKKDLANKGGEGSTMTPLEVQSYQGIVQSIISFCRAVGLQ